MNASSQISTACLRNQNSVLLQCSAYYKNLHLLAGMIVMVTVECGNFVLN